MFTTPTHIGGLAATTVGDGPSLVLLHANGGEQADFDAVVPGLAAAGWKVTTVDWPGHGASPRREPEGALAFAELLPAVLADVPGAPHVVLGNSVGGFAAIRAAAARPDLVRGLVLVDPGGFTVRWPGTLLACRFLGSERVARRAVRVLPRLYLRTRSPQVDAVIERASAAADDPERVAVWASVWRSFTDRRHDAREAARSIACPVLLAWGSRDPVLPWLLDGRRARRALPQAEVHRFRCGHQVFVERPDDFLATVVAFLAPLRQAPS